MNDVISLVLRMHRKIAIAPRRATGRWSALTVARMMLTIILRHGKDLHADMVHDFVVQPEYAVMYLLTIRG